MVDYPSRTRLKILLAKAEIVELKITRLYQTHLIQVNTNTGLNV